MKEEEIFESTPFLGYYDKTCTKFKDIELFDKSHRNYIRLKKVKIWYGDFGQSDYDDEIYEKNIIGIQCEYLDSISGETKSTDMYCGKISGEDINTKVLDLSNSDYITKFIICFNKILNFFLIVCSYCSFGNIFTCYIFHIMKIIIFQTINTIICFSI